MKQENRQTFKRFLIISILNVSLLSLVSAQISGTVFQDFNNNGTQQVSNPIESGLSGVTITAYDNIGTALASTTSSASGTYSFTVAQIPSAKSVRLEFVLPEYYFATRELSGNSVVQFVSAPSTTANLAVNYPQNYCQTNPKIAATCYINGDINTTAPVDVLVSWDYTASGQTHATLASLSAKANIGSTWSLAYSRTQKQLYSATFVKRHVGIGASGLGAIYKIDPNSGVDNGTLFATIPNVGTISTNAARGLTSPTVANLDTAAFRLVGTVGLGGMEFSEDEKTLYVINLNDKKLYSVDMATQAVSVVTTIVDPGCTGGVSRPFALKMWRGKLYVGIICDASTTGHTITSNLKAFVYSLDLTTNVFTQVLNIPMDYLRSSAWNETAYGGASGMPVSSRFWYPWENSFVPANFGGYAGLVNGNTLQYKICHPSPILSDIEFDVDGGMILGFTDRTSHQFGDNNMAPDNIGRLETVISGGDILRASPNAATTLWTSETLTPYSATTTYTATTPAPTEYYAGEVFSRHNETAQGGLALLAGQGEVVTTSLDPFVFYSGGTIKLSNTTGLQSTSGYQLFVSINGGNNGGYAGKATGLGDLKLLCNPQPIEIGNRVWADRNRNGIQDATEVGIGNVSVVLYADFDQNGIPDGAALATVATNTTTGNLLGTYFFNETNVPDGDPTVVGNQVGLQPHKTYLVRIGSTSWSSGIGIGALASSKYLTTPNQTPTAGIQDEIDSDAISVSMIPTISVTTGSAGQNNHSLDFGFTTPVCGAPICLPVAITRQ